jgi:hypothetical protein
MSETTHGEDRASAPPPSPSRGPGARVMKVVAGVAAVGALILGANAIAGDATPATSAAAQGTPPAGQAAGARGATPPGMGTEVTGTTLAKLKAAATARYPGTVERAMELADGSYVVHVVRSDGSGEVHVLVSKAFAVTGVDTGPPAGRLE